MKKLLIAMTAAAVGTCAWAEGEQTLLNETFEADWTLTNNTWWTYSAGEAADGELTLADGKLSLNTGSKVLTGSFTSDDKPRAIGTDGLYFNATVTFKDPSDTLPTLGAQDKFALVVLDNVESCETYNTEENPVVTPATNLWVIAKYGAGEGVKRAYKLKIPVTGKKPEQDENGGDVLTNLDKAWLDVPHEIVVKAYGNVMADSQTPRAGFMVMVDGYICTVDCSCAIEGNGAGVINPTQAGTPVYAGDVYLGFAKDAINGTLNPRYNKNQLLLSMTDNNAELTSVDFQGQGVIDNVSLAATGADFGADATVLTFAGYDATKIASITVAGKTVTGGAYTILGNEDKDADNKSTITVTVQEGYVLDMTGWTKNGLTYTYLYELPTESAEISLNVFAPAAYVGNKAYESLAKALEEVTAGATIELAGNVMVENNTSFAISGDITIDLMGKTIASPAPETLAVFEVSDCTLTIQDSVGGGKVDGAIIGEDAAYNLIGGSFKDVYPFVLLREGEDALTFDFPVATGFDLINDYYVIKAGSSYTESEKLVEGEMTEAATETLDAIAEAIGESAGDDEVATYIANAYGTDEDGKPIKVTVATLADAVNVAVSVKNNLPLMTSENAEFVAEAVAADDGNVAAFEFTLQDGSADKVLPLTVKAKLEKIIKVCTDLNTWVNAKIEAEGVADADVKATVSNGKVKVQLKSKTGGKCFMKLKAE